MPAAAASAAVTSAGISLLVSEPASTGALKSSFSTVGVVGVATAGAFTVAASLLLSVVALILVPDASVFGSFAFLVTSVTVAPVPAPYTVTPFSALPESASPAAALMFFAVSLADDADIS